MSSTADRLSPLPDDVLVRILSFAPTNEAAATTLLSRRWRSLWRRTTAVNLDNRPYAEIYRDGYYRSSRFEDFFYDAHAALRRRRRGCRCRRRPGIKRLSLFLEKGTYYISKSWWRREEDDAEPDRRVTELLADPAVARLGELSIGCGEEGHSRDDRYFPPLASLPCAATLRVLELTNCNVEPPSTGLAFPCLTDLTLRNCFLLEGYLQDMVDAAPALTSLALVNVKQRAAELPDSDKRFYASDYFRLPLRLRCPTVNALVLVTFVSDKEVKAYAAGGSGIELDMPSLHFFRFKGYPVKLLLASPAPGLARVDIDVAYRHQRGYWAYQLPSRIIANFSCTRALKLRLRFIEDIVAGEDKDGGIVLPELPNLELLELDAEFQSIEKNRAVATARLLSACPVMSELRLKLNVRSDYYDEDFKEHVGGPFGETMERFERLACKSSAVDLGGVSELPDALTSSCAFRCLQTSLREVTLQYKASKVNCFPAQLAKFLVENAMVREEMHVDDGSQFWPDHLRHKVARWRAESFRRKKMADTAPGFRVFQLQVDKPVGDSDEEPYFGGHD